MSGGRLQRKFLIAFASSLLVTPSLVGQQKFTGRRLAQSPVPSPVASSPVPLPPEQMPASPPEVQFHQGQLTIRASNSTLGDILRAVGKETEASVDVPGNATERVVGQFGPGQARDVLASVEQIALQLRLIGIGRKLFCSGPGHSDFTVQRKRWACSNGECLAAGSARPG